MSKKRFSKGLDDLFSSSPTSQDARFGETVSAPAAERKPAHKSFATDLDALLQEALDESLERYEAAQSDSPAARVKSKSSATTSSAPTGLDALIRQTVDLQEFATDETTGKKRLTVAVDKPKLEKLKAIARLENAYLKDLLTSLIDEYIEEYVQEKGVVL
jgi:hypothetical protein